VTEVVRAFNTTGPGGVEGDSMKTEASDPGTIRE